MNIEQLRAQVRDRLARFHGRPWTERDVDRLTKWIHRAALEGGRR